MIRIDLTCLCLFVCVSATFGQITGNIFTQDPRAQAITAEHQAMLCGKRWICIDISETRRGLENKPVHNNRSIEFGCDGKYDYNGNWTVVNGQFLKITLPPNPNFNWLLNGKYSLYLLTDSSLVLGQVLTSTGDWAKEYTFTTVAPSPRSTPLLHQRNDSVRSGTQTKYYPDGRIRSMETHALIERKLSAEELFLKNFEMYGDRFNPLDSTIQEYIPQGEWLYYHSNGIISAKYYFDKEGERIGKWLFYDADGRLIETETYDESGRSDYFDQYEYSKQATLPLIRRNGVRRRQTFIIGSKDSMELSSIDFHIVQSANSYVVKDLKLKNLSKHDVRLNFRTNPLFNTQPINLSLKPHDSTMLNLRIRVPEGPGNDAIHIESSEWKLDVSVKYLGYHLTNADFDLGELKKLPRKIFFYRSSDDHELNIKGSGTERTLPISKQVSEINLKKGKYQFTLVGKSSRMINVEVQ